MKQDSTVPWFSTRLQLFLSYSFSYSNFHTNKEGGSRWLIKLENY